MREKKSVMQKKQKGTLRQRTKSSENNAAKMKTTKDNGDPHSKGSRFKGAVTHRKKSGPLQKAVSKDSVTNKRNGAFREAEPRTTNSMLSSVDNEDDVGADLMMEIRKEEIKEITEREKKEEKKDSRKEEKKEERKDSKKDEKKDSRKEEKKDSREEKKDEKKEDAKEEKKDEKKLEKKDDVKDFKDFKDFKDDYMHNIREKADENQQKQRRCRMWFGMPAALNFLQKNNNIQKIRQEFEFLDSLVFYKSTDAFTQNAVRNRRGSPKIYDENRVKLSRLENEDFNYINASYIKMNDFNHKLIVAQLPQLENDSFVEDFWHMIYQEQINLVYLMVPDNVLNKSATSLFKDETGQYQYVGRMFINNRKSDVAGDPKEYTIEVLPEGNSDSVICYVHHHSSWDHMQQPRKTRPIIKMIHQFLTEKQIQNARVCVVSVLGCGRACSFIGALYAINQLNNGIEPNICDIMRAIMRQRPRATESFPQYAGVYAIVLDYISRKRGSKKDPINKDINRFIDEITDITPVASPN